MGNEITSKDFWYLGMASILLSVLSNSGFSSFILLLMGGTCFIFHYKAEKKEKKRRRRK